MFVGLVESFLCRFVETIILYLSSVYDFHHDLYDLSKHRLIKVYDLLKFMICTIFINHHTKVV